MCESTAARRHTPAPVATEKELRVTCCLLQNVVGRLQGTEMSRDVAGLARTCRRYSQRFRQARPWQQFTGAKLDDGTQLLLRKTLILWLRTARPLPPLRRPLTR